MPKLVWSTFLERHPAAHLAAGVMPESEPMKAEARLQLGLVAKLIARLALKGAYALTIDRQGRTPEVHCVFEKETDALKVASTVGATATGRYPGWASQRTFLLDAYASRAIAAALLEHRGRPGPRAATLRN
ncbi:MAG: hypothetical protein QOJ15_9250 [Bradyrhizobium sp.]|jgi:hypothetical protein|nr:hypothetical protein [Bradyrhizobium sp.]